MGYTLDQLLDATGLDDLSGRGLNKQASAPPEQDLSKLAAQLRRASEAPSAEEDHSDLVEKTAAIAVLERTLEEIAAVDGGGPIQKTASPTGPKARFIKEALEAGHNPTEIAEFLQKEARGGFGRLIQNFRTSRSISKGRKALAKSDEVMSTARGNIVETLRRSEKLPTEKKERLLASLRTKIGDEELARALESGGLKGYQKVPLARTVRKNTAKAAVGEAAPQPKKPDKAIGMNIGGTTVGLTNKQVQKVKGPAAYGIPERVY